VVVFKNSRRVHFDFMFTPFRQKKGRGLIAGIIIQFTVSLSIFFARRFGLWPLT